MSIRHEPQRLPAAPETSYLKGFLVTVLE